MGRRRVKKTKILNGDQVRIDKKGGNKNES
jgi:hypothetical protein